MSGPAHDTGARPPLPLAVLISGRGSNLAAIAGACATGRIAARVACVIADRPDAGGLEVARAAGLPAEVIAPGQFADRAGYEAALDAALARHEAHLVVLAGYMRVLSAAFVERHTGQLINIHPALLPAYRGLHTHRRVLAADEREHGASVHYVTAQVDDGPLIGQARLQVRRGEDESELMARVQRLEHRLYPHIIGLIADGRLQLRGAEVLLDGRPLSQPLTEPEPETDDVVATH